MISYRQHTLLGAKLFLVRALLRYIHVHLSNGLGMQTKSARLANRLLNLIDDLRNELDDVVYKECSHLTTDEWYRVYRSEPRLTSSDIQYVNFLQIVSDDAISDANELVN